MSKVYKIGTVETLRVNSSGRRFYMNLDTFTVKAYGIEPGDLLRVKIEEGVRPDDEGTQHLLKSVASPRKKEEGENGKEGT